MNPSSSIVDPDPKAAAKDPGSPSVGFSNRSAAAATARTASAVAVGYGGAPERVGTVGTVGTVAADGSCSITARSMRL